VADARVPRPVSIRIRDGGAIISRELVLVEGQNITLTSALVDGHVELTIGASGGGAGTPASSVTDETTYGITPAVGQSTNYAREDHIHGTPAAPTAASVGADAVGTAAAGDAAHVAAGDPHTQYALESALGSAAALNASTSPAASGLLQLDAAGWFGMSAVLASWRYAASFASFVNNATSGYGFSISVAGTSTTPSTSAYSHRYSTTNCGWFVSARLASRTQGFAYALIFKLPSSITSRRLWIGLGSRTMSDSDTAAGEFVGTRWSTVATDAGFMPASRDGTSQTIGTAGSSPVADVPYMMLISGATGGSSVAVKIIRLDTGATGLDVSISATLPAAGTALDWLIYNHGQGTSRAVEMSQAVRLLPVT
jgi:hypothetical protein